MSQTGTSAWWADVQHLRDAAERTDEARRRADRAELAARRAGRERRRVEEPAPAAARRGEHADGAPHRNGHRDGAGLPGRRTVEVRGRTVPAPAVPRSVELDRRRPPRRAAERVGSHPDRLAFWALLMGLVLILVAVSTADAATVAGVAAL
ncbi:MAG TPA: hypothetical protein VM299_06160 [Solirubrobacteraceae bacterium]|jgi:hypothetical protein|nr:hypothetical protein [Solirubrobacteraceae bacterium]